MYIKYLKIRGMKSLRSFLSFFLFIVGSSAICLRNCDSCTNLTTCTKCSFGYFLKQLTQCQPCPQNCKICNEGVNGVVCTECIQGAYLDSSSRCFLCETSCVTCQGSSTNCSSCIVGYTLNSSNFCINQKQCPQKNCLNCNDLSISSKNYICQKCQAGYYSFRRGCDKCMFPCKQCEFNLQANWNNVIKNYWIAQRMALQDRVKGGRRLLQAVTNYTENYTIWSLNIWGGASWTPQPLNNFTSMNISRVKGWTQLYYFFKAVSTNMNDQQILTLMYKSLSIFEQILNLTNSNFTQQWDHLARFINNVTNSTSWDGVKLNNKVRQAAFKNATCKVFYDGYGYNSQTNSYIKCMDNCLSCSISVQCSTCNADYYLLYDSSLCLQCNPLTCGRCRSPSNPRSDNTDCLECNRLFSFYPNQDGVCYKCRLLSCLQCQSGNASRCLACIEGYGIVNDICLQCPPNCISCSINTTNNVCYACRGGFELINNTCSACRSGCLKCSPRNSTLCSQCFDGLYLDKQTGACKRCMKGCQTCTNSYSCNQDQVGFTYYSDSFTQCEQGCAKCDSSDPSKCLQCQYTYFLSSYNCLSCPNNCITCSDSVNCTSCRINSVLLLNNSCASCPTNCLTCDLAQNGTIKCTSCYNGFSFINQTCTQSCNKGCLQCNVNGSCTSCLFGYALKNQTCIRCLQNCPGVCDPQNITQCVDCSRGFERFNNTCRKCFEGCADCINGQCKACQDQYRLTQISGSFICLKQCRYPCVNCTSDKCINCTKGYTLSNDSISCLPDISCNPSCSFCVSGTFRNSSTNKCELCQTNCATCNNTNTCLSCFDGFYLNQASQCIGCPMPCVNCLNANACTSCRRGFVLQIIQQQKGGKPTVFGTRCIACAPGCESCQYVPNKCLKCVVGFSLRGPRCVLRYSVKYNYTIDYSYLQFLKNVELANFTRALGALLNVTEDRITIQSLRDGSSIIEGQVTAPNERQAANFQQIMLRERAKLGNYSVKTSTFQVQFQGQNYGPRERYRRDDDQDQARRIGLIIGVIIGSILLIALLVLLGCWCYRRRLRQQQQQQFPDAMSDGGKIEIASASSKGTSQRINDVL